MNIKTLKDEGLEKHFRIVISSTEIDKSIFNELQEIAPTVKMPGFRAGKVPLLMVKKKYGASIRSDVINKEIRQSVEKLLKDKKLKTISTPSVDDLTAEDGKDLEFTLKMEIFPEMTGLDFKKIKLERPVAKPTDEDIDTRLNEIAASNVSFNKESKAKAAKGDQVTLDCVGYINGKAFDGGTLNDHKLVLGSGTFIPGYEEQLIGSKAGDEMLVKVTFPDNYHAKEMAGKESEFKVKIHAIHKPEAAKIDDELAKKFGMKDVAELRTRIADTMRSSFDADILTILKMKLFDQLEKSLTFDVPATMLEREYKMIKAQADKSQEGEKSSKNKPSDKKLDESLHRIALRRVRIGLMLADYAERHNITLNQNDLKEAIMTQARMFPGQEQMIFDYYSKNQKALESLRGPILEEKAVKQILETEAAVKDKEYSIASLEKFLKEENDKELI
jgi:trigger factor